MPNDFARRLAAVPEDILDMAKGTAPRNACMEEVLATAEMLMDHIAGKKKVNLDVPHVQPFLTKRQTKVLSAVLCGDVIDEEDYECFVNLREWFCSMNCCK